MLSTLLLTYDIFDNTKFNANLKFGAFNHFMDKKRVNQSQSNECWKHQIQDKTRSQLGIVNYYLKCSSKNLSNQKKYFCFSFFFKTKRELKCQNELLNYFCNIITSVCFDFLTNFWWNNWRFIINVEERLCQTWPSS